MLRATVLWMHLATGVAAGLVVLMMAATGVILTYERQILAATASAHRIAIPANQDRLPIDALIATARHDGFAPTDVVIRSDPAAPTELRAGRTGSRLVNPYRGVQVAPANERLDAFFSAVTRWHRWFDAGEDNRGVARAVTGAGNLAFLFLLVSGVFLWLPRVFTF